MQNGQFYEATLPVHYCPSRSGCRAIITQSDGNTKFVLTENFMLTLKVCYFNSVTSFQMHAFLSNRNQATKTCISIICWSSRPIFTTTDTWKKKTSIVLANSFPLVGAITLISTQLRKVSVEIRCFL
jgi:hypothetical protein